MRPRAGKADNTAGTPLQFKNKTGLIRLYIAGLPLRSCWTIGLPSVGGPPNVRFIVSGSSRIRTHDLVITVRTCYRCATLTPKYYFVSDSHMISEHFMQYFCVGGKDRKYVKLNYNINQVESGNLEHVRYNVYQNNKR